jgi:NTP pyrophosphatase (non-canonical NTP hydrolase)
VSGAYLQHRVRKLRLQCGSRRPARQRLELDEYQRLAVLTNEVKSKGRDALNFLLLGLYGEVGSLLSEIKKKQRDENAYFAFAASAREEFGDVLWYFANIAQTARLKLSTIAAQAKWNGGNRKKPKTFADLRAGGWTFSGPTAGSLAERHLLRLAAAVGQLIERAGAGTVDRNDLYRVLAEIFAALLSAARGAKINPEDAAVFNIEKTFSRFPIVKDWGVPFDKDCNADEQFPAKLEITFKEKRSKGKGVYVIQEWRGVHVGDRLTDNSALQDGYRFHDVFHLSYATYLGWSPVLRALLKLKRKSDPEIDEQQDGARAIITEEGISNWIFAHGARHRNFRGVKRLDFALLKTIREMVKGYEVESRPLWIWEKAILSGFEMFRRLVANRGGTVTVDLRKHTMRYKPPG